MDIGTSAWVLGVIAAFAVGLAKGGLSMVGMIAVPLLALVMSPVQAAAILLPVYVLSDLGGLIAYRRDFDRQVLITLLPGAVAGVVLGWATASLVPDRGVGLMVGIIGLAFALNALIRPRLDRARKGPRFGAGSFWGVLTGYTSFVSHAGAPPYQVYVQPMGLAPMTYAGTTTVFFAIINWVKLVPYAALGQLSPGNLAIAAWLMLPAAIGVWAGLRLVRVMPPRLFYGLITWGLLLVSLRLLWVGILG